MILKQIIATVLVTLVLPAAADFTYRFQAPVQFGSGGGGPIETPAERTEPTEEDLTA